MTGAVKVDVHMHLYETQAVGDWWKAGYQIWEYGPKPDVRFSRYSGTVADAIEAMERSGFAHGIAVNLFGVNLFRAQAIDALPAELEGDERDRAIAEIDGSMPGRLRAFNYWLCDAVGSVPQITPYVAVDPGALAPEENVEHLRETADRGARGVKLHPVVQGFSPNDPRMHPVYRACVELGFPVLSHTGPAPAGVKQFAEPNAFVPMLKEFPDLTVVLAHLGGGSWQQTIEVARAFPGVAFDLSEIIQWLGAPNAPTPQETTELIQEIGPDRVLTGTDFPWYDLDHTAEQVMDLPLLSEEQKEGMLGANAVRILGLPL